MVIQKSPFPSVPVCRETLGEKVLRAVWNHGKEDPDRPALVSSKDPSCFVTFHELFIKAHSVQAFLRAHRFRPNQVAALVLGNSIEWSIFNLGVWAAGGAISGASALFTDYELERQFLDSQCTVVLTDDDHLDKVTHAAKNCDKIKIIICIRTHPGSHKPLPGNVVSWNDVVNFRPTFDIPKGDPSKMAVLPYSSGTTGSPKGVMLSHTNFGTMIDITIAHFEREVNPRFSQHFLWQHEHFILNLPFYHIFGFGLLTQCLLVGGTGVVMDKFEPVAFLKAIEKYRPRMLCTVPPILIFLAKHPVVKEYDVSSIEFINTGAAPAGSDICEEFLARHKNVKYLAQGYGMTECGMASHLPSPDLTPTYAGVGVIAPNFEMKIVDVETGKELGYEEKGEICTRGPTIMMGYLNKPKETAETIKNGWLHTGDIGYLARDGRTYIVDRLKELIKVKGLQVPPAELEDLLLSHPLIHDAAIIGIPDRDKGELVRAYVVRANESLSEDDVVKFVAHKVSSYKHITGGVRFVKEIPKSAAGKILRRVLREDAAAEAKGQKSKL